MISNWPLTGPSLPGIASAFVDETLRITAGNATPAVEITHQAPLGIRPLSNPSMARRDPEWLIAMRNEGNARTRKKVKVGRDRQT
jgi:hypothetical protein